MGEFGPPLALIPARMVAVFPRNSLNSHIMLPDEDGAQQVVFFP